MKKFLILLMVCTGFLSTRAQIDAGLFRYPDVSKTQIVFTYANDLWLVPKEGGTAVRLSSPPGVESFPKFSPDGKTIAFSGNYDGNLDVYAIPASGGIPIRLTEHSYADRVVDWQPDGKRILFASIRESGKDLIRFTQLHHPGVLQRNCRWPMQNSDHILPMESKWHLPSEPRFLGTGKDIAVDGMPTYTYSILKPWPLKIFLPLQMLQTNFPCGTIILFISFLIADRK